MACENLPPKVVTKLVRELKELETSPPEGIQVFINEENITDIQAVIAGPESTPYLGGSFRIKLSLPQDFPQSPPKGYFITRIFHPNISKAGEICVNTLKRDWQPTLGLRHVLMVIRCLLIEPFPESALNEEAGKLLLEDYEGYARHARLMTDIHALKESPQQADQSAAEPVLQQQQQRQQMPLTVNSANTESDKDNADGSHLPTLKKAKSENKKKSLERKRSLQRL